MGYAHKQHLSLTAGLPIFDFLTIDPLLGLEVLCRQGPLPSREALHKVLQSSGKPIIFGSCSSPVVGNIYPSGQKLLKAALSASPTTGKVLHLGAQIMTSVIL